jgi:hypothetical protein
MLSYNKKPCRNYYVKVRVKCPGGNERFKAIIHRLLENICTLIDDYNVTEEEFWHAVNYLHELGGRQEAALLAAGWVWSISSTCVRTPSTRQRIGKPAPAHHRRAAVRGQCAAGRRSRPDG